MSELKAYKGDIYIPVYGSVADAKVYLKSEVDKYIEELEDKHFKDLQDAEDSFKSVLELNHTEIRHHKYKRCLAVARRCHNESLWWYSKGYGFEKYDKFWEKWEKRWLELAEQFKEANNA